MLARGLLQGLMIFVGVGTQKLREIGVAQAIPGDGEYNIVR